MREQRPPPPHHHHPPPHTHIHTEAAISSRKEGLFATGRTGCPLQPSPLPFGCRETAPGTASRRSDAPAKSCPHGLSPLLPTARCHLQPPSSPSSLSSIPSAPPPRGSLDPQFPASPSPAPQPASLDRFCRPTGRLLIRLPSAHKLGTLFCFPTLPQSPQHLSPLLTTRSRHIYLSSVNPSLPKPAEALPAPLTSPHLPKACPPSLSPPPLSFTLRRPASLPPAAPHRSGQRPPAQGWV